MYCYRCNGTLDPKRDTCSKCGTDIRMYKKIIYASNRYYNSALVKAEARNLSGAREDLEQSLCLYKKNIQARNLLGLVLYAMGEPAEALKEWVISKNLSADSQVADRYINRMRHTVREMDSEGHGVKKLNQAIAYLNNDAKDLALIQLKKICSVHTNMTKAYNLLALLYMQDGKYEQAKKVLNKCLSVDSGNVTAFRYLKEIGQAEAAGNSQNVGTVGDEDREQLIIPVRFRDYGSYLSNALYVLLGLALGLLIAWFVIVPGRVEKKTQGVQAELQSLEFANASLQAQVKAGSEEEESTEPLPSVDPSVDTESETEDPLANVIEKLPQHPALNQSWRLNQEAVEQCVHSVNVPDYPTTIRTFVTIDPANLSEANRTHYINIANAIFDPGARSVMYTNAANCFDTQRYKDAAYYYDALSLLYPEDGTLKIRAGLSYENLGERDKALNRYWQAAVLYPGTAVGDEGTSRYLTMSGNPEVPPLQAGINIEEETAAKPLEYYLNQLSE